MEDVFLRKAKQSLECAVKKDRISLLQGSEGEAQRLPALNEGHISPRCAIPENFKLQLQSEGGSIQFLNDVHRYGKGVYIHYITGYLDISSNLNNGTVFRVEKRSINSGTNSVEADYDMLEKREKQPISAILKE